MKKIDILICLALLLGLTSCANMKGRDIGAITGAGLGAAAGHELTGTPLGAAAGAVVGGVAGHGIGREME